ncbi:MAG: HNH endonuclease signature motif containing protein [Desulfosporosinus sp.]|nr:HNH endonuclease signature motif containing protein [Desulfosporosinus sp.]
MSTGILRTFYASTAWKKCRDAFFYAKFGLCEDCGSLGQIVHHIKPITTNDVRTDPAKCFGWDNLKLLCRVCHELHHIKRSDGLSFDANGDIVFKK